MIYNIDLKIKFVLYFLLFCGYFDSLILYLIVFKGFGVSLYLALDQLFFFSQNHPLRKVLFSSFFQHIYSTQV